MDLEYANRVWSRRKVLSLIDGLSMPDSESVDGWADVPAVSWYQLRCRAYDTGSVNAVHDALQLEDAVSMIPDGKVRAALVLALWGWDHADIGAAIGGPRTGEQLLKEGVRLIVRGEQRRNDLA